MIADPAIRAAKATLAAHRKALKAARPKRVQPVAEGQRKPRVREPGFLAYLRRQPCAVRAGGGCEGPIEAAHIRMARPGFGSTGMQRKPDDQYAVPLCRGHHRDGPDAQHRISERVWWAARGLDPFVLAEGFHADYLAGFERRRTAP